MRRKGSKGRMRKERLTWLREMGDQFSVEPGTDLK
jgi:hypothetical protein